MSLSMSNKGEAPDALHPIGDFLPSWSARRVADNARAGRIPGAVKICRAWMMTRTAFEKWISGAAVRSDVEAETELRRRGVLS